MSNLKVIVCSNNPGRVIRKGVLWPDHNQSVQTPKEYKKLWECLIKNEMESQAGCPMDTLFVINGTESRMVKFFVPYDEKVTPNGRIRIAVRNNDGGSFGGYDYAYRNFKYDYYLFTEDDLIISGENYFSEVQKLLVEDCGFVGLIGISPWASHPEHCHGGVGMTSREILDKVATNNEGHLPHHNGRWNRQEAITDGEIPFTNEIIKAGYKLKAYGQTGWDNFVTPYYDLQ